MRCIRGVNILISMISLASHPESGKEQPLKRVCIADRPLTKSAPTSAEEAALQKSPVETVADIPTETTNRTSSANVSAEIASLPTSETAATTSSEKRAVRRPIPSRPRPDYTSRFMRSPEIVSEPDERPTDAVDTPPMPSIARAPNPLGSRQPKNVVKGKARLPKPVTDHTSKPIKPSKANASKANVTPPDEPADLGARQSGRLQTKPRATYNKRGEIFREGKRIMDGAVDNSRPLKRVSRQEGVESFSNARGGGKQGGRGK